MSIRDELIAALGDQRLQIAQAMGESGCASGCHSTIVTPPFHLMTHEELVQTATLLYGFIELNKKGFEPDRGECKLEEVDIDCDTASGYMLAREWCFDAVYKCSCGCRFGHVAHDRPRYCPNCGRKVVEQ